jgi:hypothetical protein
MEKTSKILTLTPEEEVMVIMYIVNYYECDTICWNSIANIIRKYNMRMTGTVYRGQGSPRITNENFFFSTSTLSAMAELFRPVDWNAPGEPKKLCCHHTIHLINAPVLNTRSINYTFSDAVRKLYEDLNPEKPWSQVEPLINEMVFTDEDENGEEIIVLNGGKFYGNSDLTRRGFKRNDENHYESWYTLSKSGGTRKYRKKLIKSKVGRSLSSK